MQLTRRDRPRKSLGSSRGASRRTAAPYHSSIWVTRRIEASGKFEFKCPKLLNATLDNVAGPQPNLLIFRLASDNAVRGSGEDNVAWLECPMFRDIGDDLVAIKDEVICRPGLSHL